MFTASYFSLLLTNVLYIFRQGQKQSECQAVSEDGTKVSVRGLSVTWELSTLLWNHKGLMSNLCILAHISLQGGANKKRQIGDLVLSMSFLCGLALQAHN